MPNRLVTALVVAMAAVTVYSVALWVPDQAPSPALETNAWIVVVLACLMFALVSRMDRGKPPPPFESERPWG